MEAYQSGGIVAVNRALISSDRLQHALSRVGAEIALQPNEGGTMLANILSIGAAGEHHVLPEWGVSGTGQASSVAHQQQAWFHADASTDDEVEGGGAVRRRGARAKAKADASAVAAEVAQQEGDGADPGANQGS